MATLIDKEFFARLNALNEKFAASVPDTLARLRGYQAAFNPEAPDALIVTDLHQTLHTIALGRDLRVPRIRPAGAQPRAAAAGPDGVRDGGGGRLAPVAGGAGRVSGLGRTQCAGGKLPGWRRPAVAPRSCCLCVNATRWAMIV
ncbi:hypothetical protein LP419_00475 [Massilia sp. H-1]|nr:hypothetical protein LP419_00475 [Massilia sp. H-1]